MAVPPSPTQRTLTPSGVLGYAREAFGTEIGVTECAPLSGGGFAAVWRVELTDGRSVVLKVGPPPEARLLRYEAGIIAAEAEYFRLVGARAPGVPVPEVLHHGGDWLFTSMLPGTPLPDLERGGESVRRELGAAVARLHTVTGGHFGYPRARANAPTWPEALMSIVDDLLADGDDWGVVLPVEPERVRATVAAHAGVLAAVERPVLVHFDLWDGNVLGLAGTDGVVHLSGVVDGERYLYGDPLVDFVSPAIFQRIEEQPEHPYRLGYEAERGSPLVLDEAARQRLGLYRLHLYLLMIVEMPSRGMTRQNSPERYRALPELLAEQVKALSG
jgi:fructosamine-3-kinase